MAVKYKNRNLLPLLAITAFFLSVGLVNFTQVSDSKVASTQSVLSKSDEVRTEAKVEDKDEDEDEVEVKEEVEIKDEVEDEVESEFEQEIETETEAASADGKVNKFKLKVKEKTVDSKKVEDTVNNLVDDNVLDTPISYEVKTDEKNVVKYEVQGTEDKRFLGIFKVVLPKMLTVSATTGEVISSDQNIWTRFLSFLSI